MKRTIAAILAVTAALAAFAACGKEKSTDSNSLKGADFQSEVGTLQPDPLATSTTEAEEDKTEDNSTETAPSASTDTPENHDSDNKGGEAGIENGEVDPLGGGAFNYDPNGAVVFKDSEEADQRMLIAAAQALFESACRTEWVYNFDCPYTLDTDTFIENEFGWKFSLITDPSITSYEDVMNGYYKVFSDKYPHDLSELYIERDGRVYALCGARGGNIFYSASKVSSVKSVTEDEIFFTVTNYYDGTDLDGSKPYQEEADFSAVIDSDGVWHAGLFKLPY